mmetsp:Transcript_20447/g.56498  ORF Transcript_20447/g.56498 Transcript_20447/m.56498 type:complete len:248 (-) Transcript_20447:365-1108(-)
MHSIPHASVRATAPSLIAGCRLRSTCRSALRRGERHSAAEVPVQVLRQTTCCVRKKAGRPRLAKKPNLRHVPGSVLSQGFLPTASTYATTPHAKRSAEKVSQGSSPHISGARYQGFPTEPRTRRRPPTSAVSKSMRTASNRGRALHSTFSNEMSRCATPLAWSRITACSSDVITGHACHSRSGPGRLRLRCSATRSPPGMYSVTSSTSPCSSRKAPWQAQTQPPRPEDGWPRRRVRSTSCRAAPPLG